jgi:PadR family transcriptional regulator PadR
MKRVRQPSEQTTAVLIALAQDPTEWRYGYDLCQQTGLKAGSMYPILMRLADRGFLETSWESGVPAGRPARHLYRLTSTGLDLVSGLTETQSQAVKGKRARLQPQTEGA